MAGRVRGSLGRLTREAREAALEILESPEYRDSLIERASEGTLPPVIEVMLWTYAYGKPKDYTGDEQVDGRDVKGLSMPELADRVTAITHKIRTLSAPNPQDVEEEQHGLHQAGKRLLRLLPARARVTTIDGEAMIITEDPRK